MKEFINNEMMVHVPLCTHKNPQNILIICDNPLALEQEVAKHNSVAYKSIPATLEALRLEADMAYDVAICMMDYDAALVAHLNRVLKSDGVLVMEHPHLDDVTSNTTLMQVLFNYFKIIMPFHISDGNTALLASKEYHPTADLILHRADMLDGLKFYNSDIHPAAFAMGNYIRKAYLGVIKN